MNQNAYIPFNSLEQAKVDAKTFYKLLEKHFAIKKSNMSYKYDIYAKYFGYKGFSDAKNNAKLFSDKEYLPPCFNNPIDGNNFKSTLSFITSIIEQNKTELTPNDSMMGLYRGAFYKDLQKEIAISSKNELVEANIEDFKITSNCKSKNDNKYYYFVYTHPDTKAYIYVELTKETLQKLKDDILQTREWNKEKEDDDNYLVQDNYIKTSITNENVPLYRIPSGNFIKVHGKSVIGCRNNKADYMLTYMLKDDRKGNTLFFDLFVNESQIEQFLYQMSIHLK